MSGSSAVFEQIGQFEPVYSLRGEIALSPVWPEGGVCLLPFTGQTLVLSSFAAEVLSFLQEGGNIGLNALCAWFEASEESEGMLSHDLQQAICDCLSELERLRVISRVAP